MADARACGIVLQKAVSADRLSGRSWMTYKAIGWCAV